MGKISFWLFPNLNEDLGVIESFKPLYSLKKRKTKKSKKSKESKDSNENSKAQTTVEEVAADTNEVTAEETAEGQEVNDDNTWRIGRLLEYRQCSFNVNNTFIVLAIIQN